MRICGRELQKQYVPKDNVEAVRAACATWREELAEGREAIRRGTPVLEWLSSSVAERNQKLMIQRAVAAPGGFQDLFDHAAGRKGDLRLRIRAMGILFGVKSCAKQRQMPR